MVEMRNLNQFLKNRNGRWHYRRRVPSAYKQVDKRGTIRTSLRTRSIDVARARRDALAEADELYWVSLCGTANSSFTPAVTRYRAAKKRAMARGYIYTPVAELADEGPLDEILGRLQAVERSPKLKKPEADALLGTVKPAAPKVSEAFEIYCNQICVSDLIGKSEAQKANWKKVKRRAIINFTRLFGDIPMNEITRKHAREFYNWWGERINPKDGSKPLHPNSANRDIGNMRTLYQAYWNFEGEENRDNPFRKLRFSGVVYKDIPPFENDWMQSKLLAPGMFDGLNEEATLIIYAMIETGCRPSEIANLLPENIILDHDVPHLEIRQRGDRKLKSHSSVRDIPLLGVSQDAHALSGLLEL